MTVLLTNPIRLAFHHHLKILKETLEDLGMTVLVVEAKRTERLEEASFLLRLKNAFSFYRECYRCSRNPDITEILVCWPLAGYIDFLIWALIAHRGQRTRIIIHDVVPPGKFRELKSWGYLPTGRVMETLVRCVGRHVSTIVHTTGALEVLSERGWSHIEYLPLPVGRGSSISRETSRPSSLLVAGQYKPIREIALLEELGAMRDTLQIELVVMGKGWPNMTGWTSISGFIPEADFQEMLAKCGALLIPYSKYSQSGVAIRALAAGTPIIGVHHPQLQEIYGENYPGVIDEMTAEAVIGAFNRIKEYPREYWKEVESHYRERSSVMWQQALA